MKKIFIIFLYFIFLSSVNAQVLRTSSLYTNNTVPSSNNFLTNLVAYWDFSETTGNAVDEVSSIAMAPNDSVDQSNTGKLGNCYSYNGSTDYLSTDDITALRMYDQDFTFAVWINVSPTEGVDQFIFGGENGAAGITWFWTTAEGEGGTYGRISPAKLGYGGANGNYNVPVNQWVFIAMIFDSTAETNNVTMYVNGSTYTVTYNENFESTSATNVIGARRATSNFFSGMIDDLMIWKSRKLTTDELDDIYENELTYADFN